MLTEFSILAFVSGIVALAVLIFATWHLMSATSKTSTARPPGKNDELTPVELNATLYTKLILAVAIAGVTLILFGISTWRVDLWDWNDVGFNLGFPLILAPLIYLAFSVRAVAKDCRAALYFYGIALKNVGPGPHFVPRFLVSLEAQPIDVQEIIEPGPRDQIYWGDEKTPMPKGMVRPIFVNSRSSRAPLPGQQPEDAPLDTQLQYGVVYYLFWTVSDDVATFVQNCRTTAEADSMLRKMSVGQLTTIVGERTAEGVIATQENTNEAFKAAVCARAIGMGVRITDVALTDINLSHEMARAMRDRAEAQFKADTVTIETKAEANRIREIGKAEGDADRERARGEILGRADGMKQMKEDLSVSGESVLAFESVREGWPKSTVLAGASAGTTDLMGTVAAVAATLGAGKASAKPLEKEGGVS